MKRERIKIRRTWGGLNPRTRVHGRRKGYDRAREKQEQRKHED